MKVLVTLLGLVLPLVCGTTVAQDFSRVPGVVIAHSPASSGVYLGSPSITVLPDGNYLASCETFGNVGVAGNVTFVYRSADRGRSWTRVSALEAQGWSSLSLLRDTLYMIGVHGPLKNAVIRRSADGGKTWTDPGTPKRGLLVPGDSAIACHCGPMPLLVHGGRVWRAMERYDTRLPWGNFSSFVISAPLDADLLDAANWTVSNGLLHPRKDVPGTTWLEGNVLSLPDRRIVNVLRCHSDTDNVACVLSVSEDGTTVALDPEIPSIPLPGACKKFTIRYDTRSRRYWSLVNYPLPRYRGINHVERTRNTVSLVSSCDLRAWEIHETLLESPDVKRTGFQYVDWCIEGDDIIAVSRTAFDDGLGGAHDCHDANFITFHRVKGFRARGGEAWPEGGSGSLEDEATGRERG